MGEYTYVAIDYERYQDTGLGTSDVFSYLQRPTPITGSLGKNTDPRDRTRQVFFERQLKRLSAHLESRFIPILIHWRTGEKNQMDKGCIGHSFVGSASFIESVARNNRDEITYVILRENHA